MQQIQCGLCGRAFTVEEGSAGTCPSCGFAVEAPAGATAAYSAPAEPTFAEPASTEPGPDVAASAAPQAAAAPAAAEPPAPLAPMEPAPVEPAAVALPPIHVMPPADLTPPPPPLEPAPPTPSEAMPLVVEQPLPAAPPTPAPVAFEQPEQPPSPQAPEQPMPAPPPASAPAAPAPPMGAPVYGAPQVPGYPPLSGYYAPPSVPLQPQAQPWGVDPRMQPAPQSGYLYPYGYGQPGPYSMPMQPMPPLPPLQPARQSRSPWLVGGIVAAVVVLLTCAILGVLIEVAGARLGSATATPTLPTTPTVAPTPTIAAPAGFSGYKDPGGLYTLAYPTGWTKVDGSSGAGIATPVAGGSGFGLVLFGDSTSGAALGVEYLQLSYPGGLAAFDEGALKGFAGNGKLSNRKGPTPVTFAGETWTQESADTTQGGETEHLVVDGISHGDYTIAIFYTASSASFASVDSASFQTMISTFKFLK